MTGQKPREIAARILREHAKGGAFLEDRLEAALASARLAPPDRRLCQELVCGVTRWRATLDWLIARKTAGRPQKPALQELLRLGLYQLFWLDRVPPHAAVNETVELAKRRGFGPQAGFVNALLRGYLREAEATGRMLEELKIRQPAVGWSHPEWLVDRWRSRWGDQPTVALLQWNNTPPATFARVNTLKAEAGKLLERWRMKENVEYDFVRRDWLEENLIFELKAHPPLASLGSFRSGWFYAQDPSTVLAVRALNPQAGDTVLDWCAAPGGKTTLLAQYMNNEGRIVARDASAERLELLRENCTRLGVTCVETCAPGDPLPRPGRFDKVLLDAPCSNTGVLRRRLDLRWRLRATELGRLRHAQRALLEEVATYVRPGGRLVYSTCSLEPEENHEVVREFLAGHPEFTLRSQRELLPFTDGVDGAYVATLDRVGAPARAALAAGGVSGPGVANA